MFYKFLFEFLELRIEFLFCVLIEVSNLKDKVKRGF